MTIACKTQKRTSEQKLELRYFLTSRSFGLMKLKFIFCIEVQLQQLGLQMHKPAQRYPARGTWGTSHRIIFRFHSVRAQ